MHIVDNIGKIRGDFKLEIISSDGVVIDTEEEHNMIMNLGRYSISSSMSGILVNPINKVVFGTLGYIGDISTPITEGTNGFEPTRTNLFSEATLGAYTYPIEFTPPITNGGFATLSGQANLDGCTVKVTYVNNVLTYEFLLSTGAANNGGAVNYTEAAIYCGTNIFAMKTFPVKVKDNSNTIKITWSFTF